MPIIAVNQRVEILPERQERRDSLDQRWAAFLEEAGFVELLMPNAEPAARNLLESLPVAGVLLTGGGELADYGGATPERDAVETLLMDHAEANALPVIGVCRGMQVIQHRFGVPLKLVNGHVAPRQTIRVRGQYEEVNSYHDLGAYETADCLEVWATADDGVVKAIRHRSQPIWGIMWHPERFSPFRDMDKALFQEVFGV